MWRGDVGVRGHAGHAHGSLVATGTSPHDESEEERSAKARVTWLGVVANVALAAAKGGVGMVAHSPVLVADAVHSVSDLASDAVVLIGSRVGTAPADDGHKYGHGRLETLATLTVASFLVATGGAIAWNGAEALLPLWGLMTDAAGQAADGHGHGHGHVHGIVGAEAVADEGLAASMSSSMLWLGLSTAVVSIATKEWLYAATRKVADKFKSELLLANAWHHRTDSLSSVVALVGLGGVAAGLPWLDPIGSMVVAGMIVHAGGSISISALRDLTDSTVLSAEEAGALQEAMEQVSGVRAVRELRHRRLGSYLVGDVTVQVDPRATVSEAHVVAVAAQSAAMATIPMLKDMVVHVEPYGMGDHDHAMLDERVFPSSLSLETLKATVAGAVPAAVAGIASVSHVECHVEDGGLALTITLELDDSEALEPVRVVGHGVKHAVHDALGETTVIRSVDIHFEG
ncbi:cation diffusion facilitator family transporter [Thecamonas trahens ATCC 50062]|uniref:Cation diffusion facilitator family transporter n=1 Tax=Thecamonas trahens ATCC 50062 TaxID=461836 RepID=A0A0L0D7T3_THETB|nr:cation diffusion facilitator family transporter [Thecamonas trahens ATCC 50062]KNC48121.1 cation diffusion facilitator family transporter [Thecamonas trahens ATCC 50062]|eukprot:XP_013758692.1 cation diffusion facilitator family transporter [Thecamonas trahens ATCC 50062]